MSYAIIRNQNHKMSDIPLLERHNERLNKNYSNKYIDLSRSSENYHLKQIQSATYQQEFDRIRTRQELKGNLRLHGEKQSNVMCEFIITSDREFFEHLGTEQTRQFFRDAYNFVCAKVSGEQYIISAVVHMDEATPHMHASYIPVIKEKDRKGNPCKRINCSEFWKGRDSYSKLQDEYFDYIVSHGYDLERGVKGSTAEHLSVAEYKLKKSNEQLVKITRQILEIESIDKIKVTGLPLNTVAVKKNDFEKLSAAAKGYAVSKIEEKENIQLKAENNYLKNCNSDLRTENKLLSDNYNQLQYSFNAFEETVADEVNILRENEKLKSENECVGNHVHTLISENKNLKNEIETKNNQIKMLNTNLDNARNLLSDIQSKFGMMLKFLERYNLKEKWKQFIKTVTRQKSR